MSRAPRTFLGCVAAVALLHGAIAVGHYAAARLVHDSGWPIVGGVDPYLIFADAAGYFGHASSPFEGRMPYRDHPIEYPVLALPVFVLPRLVTFDTRSFVAAFAVEMLLVNALLVWMVARRVRQQEGTGAVPGRLLWYTLCFAPLGPWVIGRFDIVPSALAFAAAAVWFSGRSAAGGLLAGLGALVKIVPGVVALPGMMWDLARGRNLRGTLTFGATVAIGSAVWFGLGGQGTLNSIRYHTERGIEIGSVYSGVLRIVAAIEGTGAEVVFRHGSSTLLTPHAERAASLAFPIQAAALLLVGWRSWRTRMRDPLREAGAAVTAFAVAGKVLSPQFLVWMLPFVVCLRGSTGRTARPIFLAACLLTMVVYPWGFGALKGLDLGMFAVLNARNALLIALFVLMVFGPEAPAEANREPSALEESEDRRAARIRESAAAVRVG